MAQGHFHHIQKKSADDQFSISSDSPDCEIDEESEYEGMRATESKGKEKKIRSEQLYSRRQDSKADPEATRRLPTQQLVLQNISVVGPQPPRLPVEEQRGAGAEEQSAGA